MIFELKGSNLMKLKKEQVMTKNIFEREEIFVALDTCVVRELAYESPAWLDDFIEMAKRGFHFSIADHAFAELLNQFKRGSIDEHQFKKMIEDATKFISTKLPFLSSRSELYGWIGVDVGENFKSEKESIEFSQIVWNEIKKIKNPSDIKPEIEKHLEMDRAEWKKSIDEFRNFVNDLPEPATSEEDNVIDSNINLAEELLEEMRKDIDSKARYSGHPPISVRLDVAILESFDKHIMSLIDEYNPYSDKRKNDGIDFNMSMIFMLPSLVCAEKKYTKYIRGLGSFQSNWIFTPEMLVEEWKNGADLKPKWPEEGE